MTDRPGALDARYRALFETTLDGIVILDDSGTYVEVNEALCTMLGASRRELLGRPFTDFVPPRRLPDAVSAFAQLQRDGTIAFEFPLLRKDGSEINLEWRSRSNAELGLYFCVARDLSARDALRASEERYRAFLANSSEAIWRFELREPVSTSLDPDPQIDLFYEHGYLAECNDAMARMYGFPSSSDIVGAPLGDMLLRDDPGNVEYLRAFIGSGYRLIGAESREVDREGNEKFFVNNLIGIVEHGMLLRAWGTQRDVSEQRATEHDRAALVARLEFLADVTSVLGSTLDYDQTLASIAAAAVPRFADWCFIDIADAQGQVERLVVQHSDPAQTALCVEMERRYPTPPETPIGPPHTIRTGVTQSYDIDTELVKTYARSDEHRQMLHDLRFHAGLVVPLVARGRTLGALSFALSESPRKFTADDVRLAEDLGRRAGMAIDNARLYGELQRANRAKDDFLAMLSHELRTPMTAMLGWASMLQTGALDATTSQTAADAIVQATRAQAHLIDDLLDVSRIVSGKMRLTLEPLHLSTSIDAAIETVRPAADAKDIHIDVTRREDVQLIGDGERLQQVFWNLLSNAVKFTPRGGRVSVELTCDATAARVSVRDTGEGIDRELLPFIFDRFRQGDSGASRKFGGLGLGLSIARNLVELHGGTVTALSEGKGRGAELTVTLPIVTESRVGERAAPAPAPPRPLEGRALLIVEDDVATRMMLEVALRRYGAAVTSADSADAAVEALAHGTFDVLISDIGLPREDGCTMLARIRAGGSTIPAIALTAYASPTERERSLDAGFQTWLAKPVDPGTLADEILRVLA